MRRQKRRGKPSRGWWKSLGSPQKSPHRSRPPKPGSVQVVCNQLARVAKPADAKDLKSFSRQRECGFESRPGHHHCKGVIGFFGPGFFLVFGSRHARKDAPPGKVPFHLRRGVRGPGLSRCSSGRRPTGSLDRKSPCLRRPMKSVDEAIPGGP